MKLGDNAQNEVENAEVVKVEVEKVKQELGSAIELKTIDDAVKIFDYVGIKAEKKDDGLVISEYRLPNLDDSNVFDYDDLEIDENKLFKYVNEIKGDADFWRSKITDLGQLQSIGRNAYFSWTKITDLGQLKSIGEHANFRHSKVEDLRQLKSIGGTAVFEESQITNLGQLQSIGGNAAFSDSKITNLGQLQSIGGNADCRDSKISIDDISKLEIGGEIKR